MKIEIMGMGCAKCKTLEKNAREAASELGVEAEIVKVTDAAAIAEMGVMMTPALAVNGRVRSVGKVLTKEQVAFYIKEAQ
jgi:small redox-active disulfide protein 2